jgi:hypothetical protein
MVSLVKLSYSDTLGFNECGSGGEFVKVTGFQLILLSPEKLRLLQAINAPKIETSHDGYGCGNQHYTPIKIEVLTDTETDPLAIASYQKLLQLSKLESEDIYQTLGQLIQRVVLQFKDVTAGAKILEVPLPPVEELRQKYRPYQHLDEDGNSEETEEEYTNMCINWYQFQKLFETTTLSQHLNLTDQFNDDETQIVFPRINHRRVLIRLRPTQNDFIYRTRLQYTNILEIKILTPDKSSFLTEIIQLYLEDQTWVQSILDQIKLSPPHGYTIDATFEKLLRQFHSTVIMDP